MAHGLEFSIGVMMLLLFADVFRKMIRDKVHFHTHQHDDKQRHFHAHKHENTANHKTDSHQHTHANAFPTKALFIGFIHGMAGSATLILLTLQSTSTNQTSLVYMLLFGVGSILGMAVLSIMIAIPLKHSARGLTWLNNGLQSLIGAATIAIGISIIYDTGKFFI